ncbi:glycosyltransferase family 39 protein [Omnitrophica bacterium]|nr:glycosyltransferase family 39 protein [Candidatus Omnitrophota bacterium]
MVSLHKDLADNRDVVRLLEVVLALLIPTLFFFLVLDFSHPGRVFEYDTDEGMCLMRGFLHAEGYHLYKEIWMDSPPFLVILLSGLFRITGPSVFHARLLFLAFSTLLVWGLFKIISKTQNLLAALFTVGLLIISSFYVRLSVSVMIGLPAVALAILSVYALLLYETGYQKRYLALSGCLLALALQTKFFVITFLPALISEIVIIERGRLEKERLIKRSVSAVAYWGVSLAAVYLYLAFVAASVDFSQIIGPYAILRDIGVSSAFQGYPVVQEWILGENGLALMALGGFIFLGRKERRFFLLPLICSILGILILSNHVPIWYHHRLLVIVPMCWLASFGFYKLFNRETWSGWGSKGRFFKIKDTLAILFLGSVLILTVVELPSKYERMTKEARRKPFIGKYRRVINLMERYKEKTRLVVTDRPIFSFYAGLPVHPYLTTSSKKRIDAGLLTAEDFIGIIQKEHPELILFARFPELRDRIAPHIEGAYELEYQNRDDSIRLYVLEKMKRDREKGRL